MPRRRRTRSCWTMQWCRAFDGWDAQLCWARNAIWINDKMFSGLFPVFEALVEMRPPECSSGYPVACIGVDIFWQLESHSDRSENPSYTT